MSTSKVNMLMRIKRLLNYHISITLALIVLFVDMFMKYRVYLNSLMLKVKIATLTLNFKHEIKTISSSSEVIGLNMCLRSVIGVISFPIRRIVCAL